MSATIMTRARIPFALMLAICAVANQAAAWPSRQPPSLKTYVPAIEKEMPFSSLKVTGQPSLGRRHAILDGLVELPDEGLSVEVFCRIYRRQTEGHLSCEPANPERYSREIANAVRQIASASRVDLTGIPDEPNIQFVTSTTLLLVPPRLKLSTEGIKLTDSNLVEFAVKPSADLLARYYPDRAQRLELNGSVRLTCQVLPDLSLACAGGEPTSEHGGEFIEAGMKIASTFVAKPELKDGSSAVGAWLSIPFTFMLPN